MKASTFDRHTIDGIAEAVVSGRRGTGSTVDAMADYLASLMQNRLEAVGLGKARGARPRRAPRRPAYAMCDRRTLALLLDRVGKHLAWQAHVRDLDESSEAR